MTNSLNELDDARECAWDDPEKAFALRDGYVATNPQDPRGYFCRHLSWMDRHAYDKALEDCNKSIEIGGAEAHRFLARGDVYRALGDHGRAVEDFTRAHDLNYDEWLTSFGPHHRADSLARLGRLDEALADCALIADDHWMPAHRGLPRGTKAEFIAEIHRRAGMAKAR